MKGALGATVLFVTASVSAGSLELMATHSPILMAFPGATIYQLDGAGIAPVAYEDTEHFSITLGFLQDRHRMLHHLLSEE